MNPLPFQFKTNVQKMIDLSDRYLATKQDFRNSTIFLSREEAKLMASEAEKMEVPPKMREELTDVMNQIRSASKMGEYKIVYLQILRTDTKEFLKEAGYTVIDVIGSSLTKNEAVIGSEISWK